MSDQERIAELENIIRAALTLQRAHADDATTTLLSLSTWAEMAAKAVQ